MEKSPHQSLINRRLAFFLIAMALAEASRTMTMVQVPVYLRELGAKIEEIGLFFTISLAFPLILRIFGGWISDTIGRLRAMTYGSIAGVLTYAAYGFASKWQFALLGPAFLALSTALIFPSYKAYIADYTTESNRGRVFGISQTVITLAWIAGPPLGGMFAERFSYRAMFAAATVTFGLAAVLFIILNHTSQPYIPSQTQKFNLSSLRCSFSEMWVVMLSGGLVTWILIVDGVRDIAFKLSFDLMPIYLRDIAAISKQDIGFLDGMFGIALALTTIPAGWLVDKTSERLGIVLGLATMILSRLSFALASAFWGFAFSWILLGIGGGLLDPAASSLIARGVPRRLRGMAYGLVATSLGIFSLPAPWIGSQIWNWIGPKAPFLITVVIGSLTILPAWFKLKVPQPTDQKEKNEAAPYTA